MALQISDFTVAAAKGDSHIIEVKAEGQVKSSGFFGRVFKSAGQNVETNQATLQAFVDSIRAEKGDVMANVVKARLLSLTDGGKPLEGRMIKTVMQEIQSLQQQTARANEQFFQRVLYDQGPSGFKAIVEQRLPRDMHISSNDLEVLAKELQFRMQKCTKENVLMTMDDVRDTLYPYRNNLAQITPEAMTRLDAFLENHTQYGLTRDQALSMRSLFITNGITSQVMINKTMELMATFSEVLPQIESCRDGGDLMGVLDELNAKFQAMFHKGQSLGGPSPEDHALPVAFQGALLAAGYTPERTMNLLTSVLKGKPGTEVCCSLNTVMAGGGSPGMFNLLQPLLGMRRMIEDAVSLVVGASYMPVEVEGGFTTPLASYDHMDEIPVTTARYLKAMGCPITPAQYGLPHHNLEAFMDFAAGKGIIPARDIYRLMQSAGDYSEPGNLCSVGFGAMVAVLQELKAIEPGNAPFSPQNVWRKLFDEPLPPGVAGNNLAFAIGNKINEKILAVLGEDAHHRKSPFMNILIDTLGVSWQRTLELVTQPGEILLTDLPMPFSFKIVPPATWELEKATLASLIGDTHRREGMPTLSIGGHDPIQLKQPVPSNEEMAAAMRYMTSEEKLDYLEEVEQIKDYNNSGIYNMVADTILAQLTELTGTAEETRAQRIGVLQALTQTTSGVFRLISPLAGGADQGQLYEHSCYNTTVTRDGDLIRIHMETPPGSPMHGALDYTVDKQGNILMTAMSIGNAP